MQPTERSSCVLILSAPSGAGKTSLARALVERRSDIGITVSHTTRRQRPGEIDGEHYHFVTKEVFSDMIDNHRFLEYATVFENYYGTSIDAVDSLINQNKHALLDIDWQGARNVRTKFPEACSVFIMPPSLDALENRLRARKQDSEETILHRMQMAMNEIEHKDEYDFVVTNDDFDHTLSEIERILISTTRA